MRRITKCEEEIQFLRDRVRDLEKKLDALRFAYHISFERIDNSYRYPDSTGYIHKYSNGISSNYEYEVRKPPDATEALLNHLGLELEMVPAYDVPEHINVTKKKKEKNNVKV